MRRVGLGLLVALVPVLAAGGQGAADPLGPELRARVERLKVEAATPAASPEILLDRLATLWDWSNAYALTGGPLPLDYSAGVGSANRTLRGGDDPDMSLVRAGRFIAASVEELTLKDERPAAIGPVELAPKGPFIAGDLVMIEETYTVGEAPVEPGGGFLVAQSSRWTQRTPTSVELSQTMDPRSLHLQVDDPAAANYVSIRCSNPAARFVAAPPSRDWLSFNVVGLVFFRLEGATLAAGDTVTVTFGDTSGGSPGMRVQHWTNDRVLLPILPVLAAGGVPLTPAWPSFRVVGRPEVRRVEAVVRPSVVAPGEPFELTVRSEDRWRQVSSGRTPAYRVEVNGEFVRELGPGSPPVTVVEGLTLSDPGVYRFTVRSPDGSLVARSNPLWVQEDTDFRVWWGDTHGHSGFADGQGTPDNYYSFARDVARLDFVTLSEHDIWLDDLEWRTLQEMTTKYLAPGRFTAILGYEWTANARNGGHHNVYFRDPAGRQRVSNQVTTTLGQLYDGLRAVHRTDDVLIIPHAHQPGDWRQNDADMERLVEVNSGHGVFEWYGNRYWQNGFDVGFVGSSDDHTGHPGYIGLTHVQFAGLAAVVAPENSARGLFDAMRSRSTYATTGERIIVDASLDGRPMGQPVPAGGQRAVRCRVMGTEPVEAIDVIRNGEVIYSRAYLEPAITPAATVEFSLSSPTDVVGLRVPRGPVQWRGTVEVRGAELVSLQPPWFANPTRYLLKRDPSDPNRVEFSINTRGRPKGLLLELAGASAATTISVRLAGGNEAEEDPEEADGSGGGDLVATLGELAEGAATRDVGPGSAALALVPGDAALDQEFSFTDLDPLAVGDYYYVRVRQVGGGLAFTSPWRVVAE